MENLDNSNDPIQQPAYTGGDAAYFTDNGLRIPTVWETAHAENRMRRDSIFPPGSTMFEGMLKTHLVTVVEPTYGLHPATDEHGNNIR